MKIILREHVDHLGDRGDVVSVAAGYARNYLLPKGLAFQATPGNLKQVALRRAAWAVAENRDVTEAEVFAARVGRTPVSIAKKAGESGTLYGSVTASEIAEALAAQGVEIDRRKLDLPEPLKALGSHEVKLKVHRKVSAVIRVEVTAEEAVE